MSGFSPETSRRPDWAALVIAVGLAIFGIVLILDAGRLPEATGYSGMGPADAPKLVGYGLIGLGLWTAIAGLRGTATARPDRQHPAPLLWIIGGLGAQLVLIGPLGFSIATGILFACTASGFGHRKPWISLPVGVVLATLVFGIFDQLLKLNLPTGWLETLIYGA
ncbi:MAG: tripartite tricarboxylate transporter TctB family protein [Cypionkella sp.]|jgi:putative tricarboxylic transport membrane protein|nr:tripartite tricarboxylate transporter TctB family protein [Cypionkella sp.]